MNTRFGGSKLGGIVIGKRSTLLAFISISALTLQVPYASSATLTRSVPFKYGYAQVTNRPVLNQSIYHDCAGVRIEHKSGWIKDSESCLITGPGVSQLVAGTYTSYPSPATSTVGAIDLPWFYNPKTWYSDFDRTTLAKSFTFTYSDNLDGTFTLNVVAYF